MFYSQLYFKKKLKIHFLLYVFTFIFFIISLFVFFVKKPKTTIILQNKLVNFEIVNLSSQQAGVYWETKDKEVTWVTLYTKDNRFVERVYEDTNEDEKNNLRNQHYVYLSQLKPNSTYIVSVENKKGKYVALNNTEYSFITPSILTRPVFMNPLYGKIIKLNGDPSIGSFVLVYIEDAFPLFTVTKSSGEWLIPLSSLVSKKTGEFFDINNKMKVSAVFFDNEKKTTINLPLEQFYLLSQSISLGKVIDFSKNGSVLSATDTLSPTDKTVQEISILYPRENAFIPAQKPLIKGKGIVNNDIYAYINSKPQYSFRTKVNSEGFWIISPKESLQPGNYVLSLNTKDEKGNRVNLMRHFIIFKSGEQVLGTATAEPTIVQPLVSPTVIASITVSPTVVPSQIVSPMAPISIAPTMVVTQEPTIVSYSSPAQLPTQIAGVYATALPTPPTTGQNNPFFFVISIMLLVSGSILIILF